MAVDLNTLPAGTRQKYIKTGRNFGSKDTLKQGRVTLKELERYEAELGAQGFDAGDKDDLKQACDMLVEAGVDRESAQGERKTTSKSYLDAMSEGKKARGTGRSVLQGTVRRLEQRPGNEETIRQVNTTLNQTQRSGADADTLANQCDQIGAALSLPAVAPVVAERGGPAAVAALSGAAAKLRAAAAQRPGRPGTPEETERLDLIDGLIVELTRDARRAARAAANELSRPALASAFELNALYGKPGAAVEEPPPGTATPPAPT